VEAGAPDSHWLHFVHELDTLSQQRLKEQRQIQRASSKPRMRPNVHRAEADLETTDPARLYADYTALVTQFMETHDD
jgi:hypothetical protein